MSAARPAKPEPPTWGTTLLNQVEALMAAIKELDTCLEGWGADAHARYVTQLAVEELGTNIIKYGYDDHNEHLIRLGARYEEPAFRIELEDDGHEFNPWLAPEPDPNLSLEERKPGGWGLSLVRRLAAGFDYERRAGRNLVSLLVPRASPPLDICGSTAQH